MDEKKQIEEMCDIAHKAVLTYCGSRYCPCDRCMFKDKPINCDECAIAHELYNAGYRKQSEGGWVWINQATGYLEPPYGDTCKCSLCEFVIDVSESNYKFCPNCGAKMRGDTE